MLFQPKNEVVAVPKVEIKWDWVGDVHFYIKSHVVIWFCNIVMRESVKHLRIKLRTAYVRYKQTHGWNGVSPTAKWVFEFHYLIMVLFSAVFSCFLLDSFELQEMVQLYQKKNMEPLSLLSTSRGVLTARVMMNMLALRYFFLNAGNRRINHWNR